MLPEGYDFRLLRLDDAAALARAYDRNREHLARWDPAREEDYFTEAGQRGSITKTLKQVEAGLFECWRLWHGEEIVGAANLQNMVRGAMQGGVVGYWVDHAHLRRGLAGAAVEHLVERGHAIGLHRLEAGTMVENVASQGVLRKHGFEQFGLVPEFLYINGAWRDHVLFQRILHDGPPRA